MRICVTNRRLLIVYYYYIFYVFFYNYIVLLFYVILLFNRNPKSDEDTKTLIIRDICNTLGKKVLIITSLSQSELLLYIYIIFLTYIFYYGTECNRLSLICAFL